MKKQITAIVLTVSLIWNSAYAAVGSSIQTSQPVVIDAGEILLSHGGLRGEITQALQQTEVLEALAKQGIQKQEVEMRLAAMSDQELQQVQKGLDRQAGGEVVVAIGLTTLIIIAVIILILR